MATQRTMEASYRRPHVKDLNRLAEIYNHAIRETAATLDTDEMTPDHFRSFTQGDKLYRMLVAEINDELVAFAATYPVFQRRTRSQLPELVIYVHPAWQRRGVGRAMLSEIHKNDFFDGLHTVLVLFNKDAAYLHQLFEEIGYIYKGELTEAVSKHWKRHSLDIYQKHVSKTRPPSELRPTVSNMSITQLINIHRPDHSYYYDLYRTIHRDPELGLQEHKTANRVAGCLQRFPGIQVKRAIGGHGLVGILQNGIGPRILLRAELDALPVMEQTGWDFASVKHMTDLNDGITKPVMHACGHDLHMVALLLAMETLCACRDHWQGTVTALFQPNEETGRGAQAMVNDGLYDSMIHDVPRPDFVLGGHSMPMRAGRVSTRIGVFNSATDGLRVTLYGRGGHSARPHTAVDPVVLASSVVMKLQTIVSRQIDPLDSAVVTVGSVQAGQTANVISDQAVMQINTRALSEDSRSQLLSSIDKMVRAECMAMNSPQEPLFETTSSFPLLKNDPSLTKDVSKAFQNHFGEAFDSDASISMGAEDMANLAQPVSAPCCFWTFGCIDPKLWDAAEARGTLSKDVHARLWRAALTPPARLGAAEKAANDGLGTLILPASDRSMEQTLATTTGREPSPLDSTGLNLLSLDGGGVRGLSTLYILKRIMDQLNFERKKSSLEAVKPCEIFDLIGGTSTGGLIAIMLGRLEMDVDQCIDAYVKLAGEVFSEKALPVDWLGRVKSKFDSKKLKDAIFEIAKIGGASGDEPFNDGKERGCKTFVCTTERLVPGTVRLRSYSLDNEQGISATIGEAALATSAAPTFFDPVSIGTRTFADGGLFANNPVDEVEGEASNVWCPETGDLKPLVKCFISLGTGVPDSKPFRTSAYKFLSETVVNISTETENTEKKFIARWAKHLDDKRYFRFNVQQGLQNVGLDEHEKQGTMDAATEAYLKHQEQKFRVRDCIQNMKLKQKRPESTPVPPKVVSTSISPKSRQQLTVHHVFWIVPFERNPRFTGRDFDLTQLVEKLSAKDYTNKIAITGLGGVGKTQVAIELLFQMREKYPDCLTIWIPAANVESLERAYTNTAEQLRIAGWEDEKADVKRLVQQYLNKESRGQWLLVFDNADDINMWIAKAVSGLQPQHGPPPLLDYLPQSKQGSILFTTRDRKTAVKLAQQNVFELPAMEKKVAVQLLEKCLLKKHLILDRRDTDALLSQLTYLPLAIVQAASYINKNGITLGDYLSLLAEQEEEVVELLSEEFEDDGRYRDMKNPVAITWLISFEQILRLCPLAAEYLSIMACVEPNDIPLSLLVPGSSRKRHTDAIGTLEAYFFISKKSDGQTLGLHRLVHLAMRNWLRQEQKLVESTEKAISRLEELFPDSNHKNRNIRRIYLTHVRCVLESDLVKKDWNTRLKLVHTYATCLYEDGRWNEAELPFAEIVELKAIFLEPNDPDMLKSKTNLASTYRHQGRWAEAEKMLMAVLKARQQVLGLEHLDTSSILNDLACMYLNQGRWAEAEFVNKEVIEIRRRLLGGEHPDTLESMAFLGSAFRGRGRLQEAEDINLDVMRTSRRVLGEEHPFTVASMANLASTYQLQERWSETEELQTEVIQKHRQKLGEHHGDTLSSKVNLALTYSKQGKWQESKRLYKDVMMVCEQILGDIHPDTQLSRANLASTYRSQGRWTEAEELEVKVMENYKLTLGDDHPSTLKSMNNLALTLKGQGRSVEAVQLMLECVRLANRRFGPDDPQTLAWSVTLAACQSTP